MTDEPVVVKNRGISIIWSLPIIALCICGWLIYTSYKDAGVEITIAFKDATGIVPGKTQIMARGIPVGLVTSVIPDLDNQQVKAVAKMDQDVVSHLVQDTLFWIVRPQLSASSIQGLDTILSGSYIGIQVGTSNKARREFNGLASSPPVPLETPGLHLQLTTDMLGSIQTGTGVYYRNIEIGAVQTYRLVENESVQIDVFIEPEFAHLVRTGSRFCNTSGIQISGKLPNVKIQIESLASLLRGGILLYTPEQLQNTPAAINGDVFALYPDLASADYGIPMTLTLTSGEDIVEKSTKVMYRGLEAGFVKDIQINNDPQRTVTAHILLDPRAELILRENTRFWLVKPEITTAGIDNLGSFFSGAHITFQPGDGAFKDSFDILPEPPPQTPLRQGRSFVLVSSDPINLSAQSPVYFKNIQVGEVVAVDLEHTADTIQIDLFIYQEYLHLLSKKSIFWIHSGLEITASLAQGLEVSTGPVANLLRGGVSFVTPEKLKKDTQEIPDEGFQFPLYSSKKDAFAKTPSLQTPGKHFLLFSENAQSLSVGAPILYKNIKIGEIEDFRLSADQEGVVIECIVYNQYKNLLQDTTRFYNVGGLKLSGSLAGLNIETGSLQSMLVGGIGCINVPGGAPLSSTKPYPLYADRQDALQVDKVEMRVLLNDNYGLKEGAPVRHKGIEIGQITELTLAENLQSIVGKIHIDKNAVPLFRSGSLIWVEQAEVGLAGVKNVQSIFFGSYLNVLQGNGPLTRTFTVQSKAPQTKIAERDGLEIVLETRHLGSLTSGSPVYYRQVQIGQVTSYELSPSFRKVLIYVSIDKQYSGIIWTNTRFWNVSGAKLEGGLFSGLTVSTASFEAILRGGIALATPDNGQTGSAQISGHHFILHDNPEQEWLDWNPNITLLEQK